MIYLILVIRTNNTSNFNRIIAMFSKAILIPGGGLDPDGTPHAWVKRSLDRAIKIFTGKEVIIPLSRGTIYKPPLLNKRDFPIYESAAGAKYLVERKIPIKNIRIETQSLDSIGNAYFSKIIFVNQLKITNIDIITAAFHMPRIKFIFKWVYGLKPAKKYNMKFITISDQNIENKILIARKKKEAQRLAETKVIANKIEDSYSFSMWLFTQHKAYSLGDFASDILNEDTLKTY